MKLQWNFVRTRGRNLCRKGEMSQLEILRVCSFNIPEISSLKYVSLLNINCLLYFR